MEKKEAQQLAQSHMHRYVGVKMADGNCYDGLVEHVDEYWLCLAVPGSVEPFRGFIPGADHIPFQSGNRGFGPGFGPSFGPGFGPGFGPYYPYPRRFGRLVLPLAALTTLALLPYYW